MNQLLAYLGLALFVVLPPCVLYARYRQGQAIPWWLVLVLIAGVGWVIVNFTTYFYGQYVCDDLGVLNDAMEDRPNACTDDGARNVFALLFGWLYGLLYAIPFFCMFVVALWLRRRRPMEDEHAA